MKDARVGWRFCVTGIGIADIVIITWVELSATILAMHFHESSLDILSQDNFSLGLPAITITLVAVR